MNDFEIIDFDPGSPEHLETMGTLHGIFLPESNVPGLGKLFMNQFYYRVLPEKGLLRCFFAKYNNKIVGIIVTNRAPYSLISRGMKGNTVKLAFIIGLSVLFKPSRIKFLISQLSYKPDPLLKQYEDSGKAFEILTIGVLPEYRSIKLEGNKKIAHKMVEHAIAYYKKQGYKYITGQILKTNIAPLKFYQAYQAKYMDSSNSDARVIMEIDLEKIGMV